MSRQSDMSQKNDPTLFTFETQYIQDVPNGHSGLLLLLEAGPELADGLIASVAPDGEHVDFSKK